jgi:hypothetical protein
VDRSQFRPNTRYTVALRTDDGKVRPRNFYVYRLYDDAMIVRFLDDDGFLHKLYYRDVLRIARTIEVSVSRRFVLPDAMLAEANWKDRRVMHVYSTSPALGK